MTAFSIKVAIVPRARRVAAQVLPNFAISALTTFAGAKGATSPPIAAICLTKVAVIGRTGAEAGRNTVRNSGAIAPFIPAICIS